MGRGRERPARKSKREEKETKIRSQRGNVEIETNQTGRKNKKENER
jgi:hypothetical protein